jgi:diaminopimelate decarboxylase
LATVASPVEELKFLTAPEVRRIAAELGTPAFVYDEETINRTAARIVSLPNAFGLKVRYSLKACPSGAIIRIFDRVGLSFDASSLWEVRRALHAGVAADKILLTAQQADFDRGLDELLDAGLGFDAGSLRQLESYGTARPGSSVSIRLNPGFGSGLVRRLTSGGPTSSFGIWHEELPQVGRILRKHGLRLTRLHSHIGSGHYPDILVHAAETLLRHARDFPEVDTINLGGGYRVKAFRDDPEWDHAEWAETVADAIRAFAADTGRELRLELEPGTFLMANSGSILARVIDVVSTGPDGYTFVKIDAGLTEIIRPSYYGTPHPVVSVPEAGYAREEVEEYCIAGHCCIAGDVLTTRAGDVEQLAPVTLPRTEPGDYLVIERAGGYCASMALKNFNSYPEAPEVLRRSSGTFEVIRAPQTFEQLIANERIPADLQPDD